MKSFSSLVGLLLFAVTSVIQAQSQLGADIDGEAAADHSGGAVSMSADGNRVAIGAVSNSGSFTSAGHVRVYNWNGSGWTQLGGDMNGEASNDNSGFSVALSADGSRVAIGSVANAGGGISGQSTGHVRVYNWNGSIWTKFGADIDGEALNDGSGQSVSLSADGNRVAIGANLNDGSFNNAGHVRVYARNGAIWTQVGADMNGEAADDESGQSVSVSADGNRVAIGARLNDGSFNNAGHVRVYEWSGSSWTQFGSDINGEAADDEFGESVSLSGVGSRVAGGAILNAGNGAQAGHVRVNSVPLQMLFKDGFEALLL